MTTKYYVILLLLLSALTACTRVSVNGSGTVSGLRTGQTGAVVSGQGTQTEGEQTDSDAQRDPGRDEFELDRQQEIDRAMDEKMSFGLK